MVKLVIKIDIVSDVVCPWYYVGKRRLEKAIDATSSEHFKCDHKNKIKANTNYFLLFSYQL